LRWLTGGRINWNGRRFKNSGNQFQVIVKSVTIECYNSLDSNDAYKYVRPKGGQKVGFKTVKLRGYGVSKKAIPTLQLQAAASSRNSGLKQSSSQPTSTFAPLPTWNAELASVQVSATTIVNVQYGTKLGTQLPPLPPLLIPGLQDVEHLKTASSIEEDMRAAQAIADQAVEDAAASLSAMP
jgi:hypothetical protein